MNITWIIFLFFHFLINLISVQFLYSLLIILMLNLYTYLCSFMGMLRNQTYFPIFPTVSLHCTINWIFRIFRCSLKVFDNIKQCLSMNLFDNFHEILLIVFQYLGLTEFICFPLKTCKVEDYTKNYLFSKVYHRPRFHSIQTLNGWLQFSC